MENRNSEGETERWMLETINIDPMVDVPIHVKNHCNVPKIPNENYKKEMTKNARNKIGLPTNDGVMKRTRSCAQRGLNSLRFLDRTISGREGDAL